MRAALHLIADLIESLLLLGFLICLFIAASLISGRV